MGNFDQWLRDSAPRPHINKKLRNEHLQVLLANMEARNKRRRSRFRLITLTLLITFAIALMKGWI
jgi:hypothetical protein